MVRVKLNALALNIYAARVPLCDATLHHPVVDA